MSAPLIAGFFFFSSRRRHTRCLSDWSSDVCSSDLVIEAGKATGLGIQKLGVGAASETIEVTTAQNLLETVQSQVTATFYTLQVQDLPTGGGFDELALLVPGVASVHGNRRANSNGATFSSNGQRDRANNFEIDGQSNNDNSVTGPQVFMSNEDAIDQIQIVSNNFSAQYGRDAGTVVNYITKSGSNSIHGTVLYRYEGSWLSSLTQSEKNPLNGFCKPGEDPVANGCTVPKVPRFDDSQFGGTIGAPILPPNWLSSKRGT